MAFSYTEILKNASPLRGGNYTGFAMGYLGNTAAETNTLISTTLASCIHVTLSIYGAAQASARVASVSSNGMIAVDLGGACSGTWIAIGN